MMFAHSTPLALGFIGALACLSLSARPSPAALVQGTNREVSTGGGFERGAPGDVSVFLASVDVAFIGSLLSVSPEFVGDDTDHVFTRMTFKVHEAIKHTGPGSVPTSIDVWKSGGTYVETVNGHRPRRPAPVGRALHVGATYFIAAARARPDSRLHGQLTLAGIDAVVQIDHGEMRPAIDSLWATGIVAAERTRSSTSGRPVDDATAFLTALRRAAAEGR